MKKISIIVPCYNVGEYVDQCLDSLVNQTMNIGDLEIILIDDASTDNTLEHLLYYENQYPQSIIVIPFEKNMKQGAARNMGLQYATAPYVMFVDADDWIESDSCRKMYRKAEKYHCDAVAAGYIEELSRTSTDVSKIKKKDQFYIIETEYERGGFVGLDFGLGFAGNLYRKEMIFENELFFPEGCYYEDDYWYVLSMHYINRAFIIGEVFYHYYQNEHSTIHDMKLEKQLDRAVVEQLKLEALVERGIYARFSSLYEHEFLERYYMQMEHILLTEFDPVPYDVIKKIHDEAYQLFPDYRDNMFVKRILDGKGGMFMKTMYEMLDKPIYEKDIDRLKILDAEDGCSWIKIRI